MIKLGGGLKEKWKNKLALSFQRWPSILKRLTEIRKFKGSGLGIGV
jgi:hypothetical protein